MKKVFESRKIFTCFIFIAVISFSLTVLNSCTKDTSTENTVDTKAEANNIMNLHKMWSDKFTEGDINWIINLHATDAIQFPPGAGIAQGHEALRAVWEGMINTEGFEASWVSTAAFVSASNDMAYDYGVVKVKNPDGTEVNAKYVVVWNRINGEWKVALDIFNFDGTSN
jgi:ketosteroid isomerase-like protein